MKHFMKNAGLLLVLAAILLELAMPGFAADRPDADDIVSQMITLYVENGEKARTPIETLLKVFKSLDIQQASAWTQIMDYWFYVNSDMEINVGMVPENLPEDDSLCIVVLGYSLNDDGSMKEELVGRCRMALECAQRYPNAYVACTGGGTAKNNSEATEADSMAVWMVENGLEESRLIVENQSRSTVENAQNTYKILSEEYPEVKQILLVTSDYHVPRGCILYNAQLLLSAAESGKEDPVTIVSNSGFNTGTEGYESIELQANGLKQIAGVTAGTNGASGDASQ